MLTEAETRPHMVAALSTRFILLGTPLPSKMLLRVGPAPIPKLLELGLGIYRLPAQHLCIVRCLGFLGNEGGMVGGRGSHFVKVI